MGSRLDAIGVARLMRGNGMSPKRNVQKDDGASTTRPAWSRSIRTSPPWHPTCNGLPTSAPWTAQGSCTWPSCSTSTPGAHRLGRGRSHDQRPASSGAARWALLTGFHWSAKPDATGLRACPSDEDHLSDQNGSSWRNKHANTAISARHGLPRGAGADQFAHQETQIVAGDMEQVSLVHVLAPAQPCPAHAAAIEVVRKGALDECSLTASWPRITAEDPVGYCPAGRRRRASAQNLSAWASEINSLPRRRRARDRTSDSVGHTFGPGRPRALRRASRSPCPGPPAASPWSLTATVTAPGPDADIPPVLDCLQVRWVVPGSGWRSWRGNRGPKPVRQLDDMRCGPLAHVRAAAFKAPASPARATVRSRGPPSRA